MKIKKLSKQNNTTLILTCDGRLNGREAFLYHSPKRKFGPAAATSDTCLLPQMNQEGKNSSFSLFCFNLKSEVFFKSIRNTQVSFMWYPYAFTIAKNNFSQAGPMILTLQEGPAWQAAQGEFSMSLSVLKLFIPAGHSHLNCVSEQNRVFQSKAGLRKHSIPSSLKRLKEVMVLI